jgi:hypothetical protein
LKERIKIILDNVREIVTEEQMGDIICKAKQTEEKDGLGVRKREIKGAIKEIHEHLKI